MLNKKSVDDINVKGKRVLCRCDFNVPLDGKKITDETRLVAALPTIKKLISDGGKVILCSHLGKPKGPDAAFSLEPVAERLSALLGQEVKFAADDTVVGENAKAAVAAMKDGDVILLENTRFRAEETKNGEAFSKDLASICDVFVNDAFGTAHRAHCSNVGVTKFVKGDCVVGYLMQKEIDFLGNAVNNPERPFVAILGGAKVSSKISVIENLLDKVDTLIIGGGIEVGEDVRTLAEKHDCIIITTPFDTFSVARLINQSMPIKQFMTQKNIITFGIECPKEKFLHVRDHLLAFRRISIDCPVHIATNGRFIFDHVLLLCANFQKVHLILVCIHKRVPRSIKTKTLHQNFFIRFNELVFCLLKFFQGIFQLAVAAFKVFLDTSEFFTRIFDFTIDVVQCAALRWHCISQALHFRIQPCNFFLFLFTE